MSVRSCRGPDGWGRSSGRQDAPGLGPLERAATLSRLRVRSSGTRSGPSARRRSPGTTTSSTDRSPISPLATGASRSSLTTSIWRGPEEVRRLRWRGEGPSPIGHVRSPSAPLRPRARSAAPVTPWWRGSPGPEAYPLATLWRHRSDTTGSCSADPPDRQRQPPPTPPHGLRSSDAPARSDPADTACARRRV